MPSLPSARCSNGKDATECPSRTHRDATQSQVGVVVAICHQVAVDSIQQRCLGHIVKSSNSSVGDCQLQGGC